MGKKSKLRKLIRREIRAALAGMAEPPGGLIGGQAGGFIGKMFGKGERLTPSRPIYVKDIGMTEFCKMVDHSPEGIRYGEYQKANTTGG